MKAKGGFTLVELLVVIAVISVLAALLLPSIENAMESARKSDCMNRQRQLMIAAHEYQNMFSVILPAVIGYYQWGQRVEGQRLLFDAGLIEPSVVVAAESYDPGTPNARLSQEASLRKQSIFMCPSGYYAGHVSGGVRYFWRNGTANLDGLTPVDYANRADAISQWGEDRSKTFSGWNPQLVGGYCQGEYPMWNPSPNRTGAIFWATPISYGMNQYLSNFQNNNMEMQNLNNVWKPIRSYSGAPSRKLFFIESYYRHGYNVGPVNGNMWYWRCTTDWAAYNYFRAPHMGGNVYSLHDGHVGFVPGTGYKGWFDRSAAEFKF